MVEINTVEFGEVKIDNKIYYSDMVIYWTGDKEFRPKSDIFELSEFKKMLEKEPDVIVVGTGMIGKLVVDPDVRKLAKTKSIHIYVEPSPKAIELFNAFIADKKHAVALIHTTG